jgi:lipopolysaccharide biosynthesis protein
MEVFFNCISRSHGHEKILMLLCHRKGMTEDVILRADRHDQRAPRKAKEGQKLFINSKNIFLPSKFNRSFSNIRKIAKSPPDCVNMMLGNWDVC